MHVVGFQDPPDAFVPFEQVADADLGREYFRHSQLPGYVRKARDSTAPVADAAPRIRCHATPCLTPPSFIAGLPQPARRVPHARTPTGDVLYVGKARDLKKRVSSYFQKSDHGPRIAADAVAGRRRRDHGDALRGRGAAPREQPDQVARAALQHPVPRRQVLSLPDDQRRRVSAPRLPPRPARPASTRYFGPFPNAGAVRESIQLLQKVFRLRTCEDSVFQNRSRPCLLHQIRRCSAPCVGLIDAARYAADVKNARAVPGGPRGRRARARSPRGCRRRRSGCDYEQAAVYRDQIRSLSTTCRAAVRRTPRRRSMPT